MKIIRLIIRETMALFGVLFCLWLLFVVLPAHGQEHISTAPPIQFRLGPARLANPEDFMDIKEFAKKNNIPQSHWIDWTPWHRRLASRLGPIIARLAEDAGYPSGEVTLRFEVSASGRVNVQDAKPTLPSNYCAQDVMRRAYQELQSYPDDLQFPRGSMRLTTFYIFETTLPPTGVVEMKPIETDFELLPAESR